MSHHNENVRGNALKSHSENIEKLRELIKDIDFAMLTTINSDGTLRSRPMSTQQVEFDGDLWFFTGRSTEKMHELQQNPQINVSYADPKQNRYVSVSGTGMMSDDRQKMQELWNPIYKAWFPGGLDDPELTLLKVQVEKAEYWDSPGGLVRALVGSVRVLATGEEIQIGENEKVQLRC